MELPDIQQVDEGTLNHLEVAFKFIRCFAEVLKHQQIPYRPVKSVDDEFTKIEIANVTRDNAEVQAGRAAAMVVSRKDNAEQNVFEFSRMAVAKPENKDNQYTIHFYGRWKTEELKERGK